MNTSVVYDYKGSQISFMSGENVMVNATQMAKPFSKQPIDWLKTNQSKEYIETFSKLKIISLADLVQVIKGGNNSGTWMHEDVALEFARWLSPSFAIWCNDRIKELLKTGVTTVSNDDEAIAYAMQVLNRRLEQAKAEKKQLEQQNAKLQPKADFADCIMQASTCISVAEMANILKQNGLFYKGQNALYGYLRYNGYLLQRGIRRNLPSQKAINKGVMRIAERPYITNGQVGFNRITVITPYGQKFFLQLFRSMKENNENIMTLF